VTVLSATDYRRAGQLLWAAHGRPDDDALVDVLRESQDDSRSVHLVLALVGLVGHGVPPLRTSDGQAWLHALLDSSTASEVLEQLHEGDDDQAEDEA